MSKGDKLEYNDVAIMCDEIVSKLGPFCERIEVAGSLRREEKMIGDIELVILPKFIGQSQVDQLALLNSLPDVAVDIPRKNLTFVALNEMAEMYSGQWFRLAQNKKDGERYKKYEVKGFDRWVQVDIFFATPENFGLIYLLRTGPASFSKHMLTRRIDGGALPNKYRSKGGYLRKPDGEKIPITNERQLFEIARYQYLAAQKRDNWQKLLRPLAAEAKIKTSDGWEAI
jgi:DNA polymerase/3'-5' exonuclease PolX